MAEYLGENKGNCSSSYPQCSASLFDFIPSAYTKDELFDVTFDPVNMGSGFTSKSIADISKEDLTKAINDGILDLIDLGFTKGKCQCN